MITYIKNYILENSRVAIRGLGTLELMYREAEIHPICQDFTPPGKYLSFCADENENGEAFSNYVAGKANVSTDEAQQQIVQWVNELNDALQTNGKYELGSMGYFVRGNVGLKFEPALDPEFSSDSFGLPAFSLREERTALFEQKEEMVQKAAPEVKKEIPAETEKKEIKTETMEEPKEYTENIVKEASVETEKKDTVEEVKLPEENESTAPQAKKPEKHVGKVIFYILLILLLCAIIAAGVYALLRPDDFVKKKDYCISRVTSLFASDTSDAEDVYLEETEQEDWYIESDDEISEDDVPSDETMAEDAVPATIEKTAATCYVIIGGFGNPANADNLVRSLKGKYSNACNLGLNERGTLTMVGIGPYTRAEAESKSQELSVTYKDCWILEK